MEAATDNQIAILNGKSIEIMILSKEMLSKMCKYTLTLTKRYT